MAISEKPLYGSVDIQRHNIIRHPDTVVYFHQFATLGGWEASPIGDIVSIVDVPYFETEDQKAIRVKRTDATTPLKLTRTFDDLVIGATYTLAVRLSTAEYSNYVKIIVDGIVATPTLARAFPRVWEGVETTFTATSTSHNVTIEAGAQSIPNFEIFVDLVSVTRHTWDEALSPEWQTYIADATNVSISRGANVKGLVQETDLGIMTWTLLNAEDPMQGSVIAPGDEIRALGTLYKYEYSYGWETPDPSWIATTDGYASSAEWAFRNGSYGFYADGRAQGTIRRTFTDLIPGKVYEASVWLWSDDADTTVTLGGSSMTMGPGPWRELKHTFTPTSSTHEVVITISSPTYDPGHTFNWYTQLDDFTLKCISAIEAPLFTGTLMDVKASYPFDKANGKQYTYVTFTAVDAVSIHEQTQRNGVRATTAQDTSWSTTRISESFEQRLERLRATSRVPMTWSGDVPVGVEYRKPVWRT